MSEQKYYLGCLSGTSVDGLDIALVAISSASKSKPSAPDSTRANNDLANSPPGIDSSPQERVELVANSTAMFDPNLRTQLLELGQPGNDDLDNLGEVDHALGVFIGRAITQFLADSGIRRDQIAAIGSHGQTVRHRPPGTSANPFTLQIGDPNLIAELTGITTVADFRRRDMAAGGQGAPLTPPFHQLLFHSIPAPKAVLNIGGICNLTLLSGRLLGFDTGPGNGLLDSWCSTHLATPYDDGGAWAASGTTDEALLNAMLEDPFFKLDPPKSTGREYFNATWLAQRLSKSGAEQLPAEDIQATLVALTAQSVAAHVKEWASEIRSMVVCGGGRLNSELMAQLTKAINQQLELDVEVTPSETWGVNGDAIEAMAFAWLAYRRINHLPANLPEVTGAAGPRLLGALYPGAG